MNENTKNNVINTTDKASIKLAKTLIHTARHGALAVIDTKTKHPNVSRIQLSTDTDGALVTLTSSLSPHTQALVENKNCALLIGDIGKGDPLAHPRITVFVTASPVLRNGQTHKRLRMRHLSRHPKASLYADFGDFAFFKLAITGASLNGGFGKAYMLDANDLSLAGDVDGFIEIEETAVEHMNADHAETIALYAQKYAKASGKNWRIATIDPEGMDLTYGDRHIRIFFPEPISDANQMRTTLKHMADQARTLED